MLLGKINTVMQCPACKSAQLHSYMLTDDYGTTVCNNCGTYIADKSLWNDATVHSPCRSDEFLNYLSCSYDICTNCGHMPAHMKDDVCIDDFGTVTCTCGTHIERCTYDENYQGV